MHIHTCAYSNALSHCSLSLSYCGCCSLIASSASFVELAFCRQVCVCFVCLLATRAICSCTVDKVGRVFYTHTNLMEFFSSVFSDIYNIQLWYIYIYFLNVPATYVGARRGLTVLFSNSQSFSLSYTNCGRINMFYWNLNWNYWKLCYY